MNSDDAERLFDAGPEGAQEWNRRRALGEPVPDLREVDLWARELPGINLSGLRLIGGCLCEAILSNADFRGAVLHSANLESVKARGACFVEADLRQSHFGVFSMGLGHSSDSADVRGADFSRARLCDADLSETLVTGARFCEADLTNADLRYSEFSSADTTNAKLDGAIWNDPVVVVEPKVHFGHWLRKQRESQGMSADELAAKIGYGLCGYDVTTFMEYKSDGVAHHLAQRLAEIFGIAISDVPSSDS
jgi:hypothetical protein